MANQNINGLKYCCRHKPKIRLKRDGSGYAVTCWECGKTVEGYASSTDAIKAWNEKIELHIKLNKSREHRPVTELEKKLGI